MLQARCILCGKRFLIEDSEYGKPVVCPDSATRFVASEAAPFGPVEWQNCDDPDLMLQYLHGRATDRQFRLFMCACARRVPELVSDAILNRAITIAEEYANNRMALSDLLQCGRSIEAIPRLELPEIKSQYVLIALGATRPEAWRGAAGCAFLAREVAPDPVTEQRAQVGLIRNIFAGQLGT